MLCDPAAPDNVAGTQVRTVVVRFERRSRPAGVDVVVQTTVYRFDPLRGLPVQWDETIHGERDRSLFKGTYDSQYVATLRSFRPS